MYPFSPPLPPLDAIQLQWQGYARASVVSINSKPLWYTILRTLVWNTRVDGETHHLHLDVRWPLGRVTYSFKKVIVQSMPVAECQAILCTRSQALPPCKKRCQCLKAEAN